MWSIYFTTKTSHGIVYLNTFSLKLSRDHLRLYCLHHHTFFVLFEKSYMYSIRFMKCKKKIYVIKKHSHHSHAISRVGNLQNDVF
jgi:hypothetical protein